MCSFKNTLEKNSDQIGITGSLICLVHCILTSGIILGSSFISHHAHHGHHHHTFDFWGIVDLSMILVSGVAVYFATRKCLKHTHSKLMWVCYLAYLASTISKYLGFEPLELSLLSYAASISLIGLHIKNIYKARKSLLQQKAI
ncbi:MerC domain-containing protein [Flammeovirga pacifica]|uniref:MerC domain-containing protein n=1 Tax=Flammeovirga pacifica TaxID=915059 RepID=A0A1S1Z0R3_FLAPC|nr:MerC domain-containing protein [Flammeovirga pacifica]OHX66773.1 hypothetical protein NH26_10600 [Flammeovirga pacifica]